MKSSSLPLSLSSVGVGLLLGSYCGCMLLELVSGAGGYSMDPTSYGANPKGEVQTVRRENSLDHWDSDTLAYYLDLQQAQTTNNNNNGHDNPNGYPGFDIAIMFYAMWDQNSQMLAPYWNQIAVTMEAGTSQSRLVMALFDCELNLAHVQLCGAVGITHYPTLMFLGSGPYHDTDPISNVLLGKQRAAGIMGDAPVPNAVKFQGNWQYIDSIKDWIRTMQALSKWHIWSTQGFGKKLRNLFWPRKRKVTSLPIGIPGTIRSSSRPTSLGEAASAAGGTGTGTGSSSATAARVQQLEKEVSLYGEVLDKKEKTIDRISLMLNNFLMGDPIGDDLFTIMKTEKIWDSTKEAVVATNDNTTQVILRSCLVELSFDYCQRTSQQVADGLVEMWSASGMSVDEMLALPNLEGQIMDAVGKAEPYCAILERCIVSDFPEGGPNVDECQPDRCPFSNPAACRYLNFCLSPSLQESYASMIAVK